jgi:DNA-binding transcriptional LysR family regulator
LNVGRLRVLIEVARQGSFSAAADTLSYTQSAVSQQIATLEAETGTTLLERHPRGVRLTAAGEALVQHAEGILARLEAAEAELAAIAGLRAGRLRMASFPTAGATLMPLAIATFRSRHPDIVLTLSEGEPEQIAPRLRAGELDLALLFEFGGPDFATEGALEAGTGGPTEAVVGGGAGGAADSPTKAAADGAAGGAADNAAEGAERLLRVELLHDPMYLALPRAHPLADRPSLRLSDLSGEAWVQTSGSSPCARHVVRCCHAAGFEPNVSFESDDYQTVQGLVAAGVGVALIPELALSVVRKDIVIRALAPSPPARTVIAAAPSDARLNPATPIMLSILREVAARRRTPPTGN